MPRTDLVRLTVLGLLLGIGLVWGVVFSVPDRRLHLVMCDVGQGDALLITLGPTQILMDGGPDERVVSCLSGNMPFWDREIEVMIMSHPQADHMNGLVEVLQRYVVSEIVVSGATNQTEGFAAFHKAVVDEGAVVHVVKAGDEISLDELSLKILWPLVQLGQLSYWRGEDPDSSVLGAGTPQGNVNETSVVLLAKFGKFGVLLTGDIGMETEQALLSEGVLEQIDVLKVPHHGSKYASSSVFLREIRPQIAVISVGKKNRYGHPTSDTLMRLDGIGAKVLRTDERGTVEIVSDGERYWVVE